MLPRPLANPPSSEASHGFQPPALMEGGPHAPRGCPSAQQMAQQKTKRAKRASSVQQLYVPFKALLGMDVLVIRGFGDPGSATTLPATSDLFRAVLEVGSVNYDLYSPAEQDALTERYRALVAALTYPIQILIRVLPLDLEPYLRALARQVSAYHQVEAKRYTYGTRWASTEAATDRAGEHRRKEERMRADQETLLHLARDHMQHVRSLAVQRGLLDRHFYLVVPATNSERALGATSARPGEAAREVVLAPLRGLRRATLPARRRRLDLARAYQQQNAARQQLDLRCAELIRQLSAMRLPARRLRGAELVDLVYNCLTPVRARHAPISTARLQAVDLPPIARLRASRESGGSAAAERAAHSAAAQPAVDWSSAKAPGSGRMSIPPPMATAPDAVFARIEDPPIEDPPLAPSSTPAAPPGPPDGVSQSVDRERPPPGGESLVGPEEWRGSGDDI